MSAAASQTIPSPRTMKRSVWAVVAGAVSAIAATLAVDAILHATHVYPPIPQPLTDGLSAVATSYRIVIGVAGAWLTARLAPRNPMKHALVLGWIGGAVSLLGAIVTWNSDLGPHWYSIGLVVLALPQSWAGAKIFERQAAAGTAAA